MAGQQGDHAGAIVGTAWAGRKHNAAHWLQVRAEVARRAAGELGGGSASTLQLEDALAAGAKVDIRVSY